ncbi:MAG: hypothetical protein KJ905_02740 [Nanoarchaeota archaeon]|nr:hypothetical protein [Nanoarchaeota archaeon]MBU1501666.1 hypothetical protein [Nanoarchaeota archaeon]MBU2459203.1 hypothetical protein [Nanoarchaeota archaeon]
MELHEEMNILRNGYKKTVKPLVERGEYMIAYFEFSNLMTIVEMRGREIISNVHMGLSYVSSAQLLRDRLLEGDKSKIESIVRMFEAYSAQTKLPLRD